MPFESSEPDQSSVEAGTQLKRELHAVIRRWADESDITIYQTLGALRIIEHDLIKMLDENET